MAYTYEALREKTIAELRDIAKDVPHEAVQGNSQMNKEHLLPALCKALGVDTIEHHQAVGIDKPGIKARTWPNARGRRRPRRDGTSRRRRDRVRAR
jgi:hypothetical protein